MYFILKNANFSANNIGKVDFTTGGVTGGGSGSGGGDSDTPVTPPVFMGEFTLTSSMLKNQTYSTAKGDWNTSNVHLATDFLALQAGYDVVFDLPDDWSGYVAHVSKTKGVSGAYDNNRTSILSGWVTKGTVSTGASLDKYFIVLQKKSKAAITPSDYESIAGSVQVKKPSARTVTLDSTTINAKKGYEHLNIITMENRLASWFYAVTPGSTVTGTVANGLKAYIISIRDGETQFAIDTDWVSSFNQTYDTACSIMIVAKKEDGSTFTDTSAWTSPVTINIK